MNRVNRDFPGFDDDGFGILLDTFEDNRNGFVFNTNPHGAKADSQVGSDGSSYNRDWDAIWYVQSKITEAGWQTEIAIPFKSLRFHEAENQDWGMNLPVKPYLSVSVVRLEGNDVDFKSEVGLDVK